MSRFLLLAALAALLAAAPTLRAQSFEVLGGRDPATGTYFGFSQLYAASYDGSVAVGSYYQPSGTWEPVYYLLAGDRTVRLEALSRASHGLHDISGNGEVIVGAERLSHCSGGSGECAYPFAYDWDDNAYARLPVPSFGSVYSVRTTGMAVSASGSVVVASLRVKRAFNSPFEYYTFRWTNGVMESLVSGDPCASTGFFYITGASADGAVAVGAGCNRAVLYDGTFHALSPLPGDIWSSGWGISADGKVAVGDSFHDGARSGWSPVRWEGGVVQGLGLVNGASGLGRAVDASRDGSIILGIERSTSANGDFATLWTAEKGMRRLIDAFQTEYGFDLSAFDLSQDGVYVVANQLTADGVIVGHGRLLAALPTLRDVAWRARLTDLDPKITVNVTGDEANQAPADDRCDVDLAAPEDQCTLRAAIGLANKRGGAQEITFDIDAEGVPSIRVAEEGEDGLPPFTSRIVLDGTTQPGGWVELVGPGQVGSTGTEPADPLIAGVEIGPGAGGSVVRGLVVHSFRASGILIQEGADGCTIEGNRIGTDVAGTQAMGNGEGYGPEYYFVADRIGGVRVRSDGNTLRRNVIAGNVRLDGDTNDGGVDVYLEASASGNVVADNAIGMGSDGRPVRGLGAGVDGTRYEGVHIDGSGNTVGGAEGAGNVIAGSDVSVAVWQLSQDPGDANDNAVSYNTIGSDYVAPDPDVFGTTIGIEVGFRSINDVQALANRTRVAHNVVTSNGPSLEVWGSDNVIESNTLTSTYGRLGYNIIQRHQQVAVGVYAGTGNAIRGNAITSNVSGVAVNVEIEEDLSVTISENDIDASWAGITFAGILGESGLDGTPHALISRNRITTDGSGIDFGLEAVTQNDPIDSDDGPNTLLNFPQVQRVARDGEVVTVEGFLQTPILSASYTVEAFSNAACASLPHTQMGALRYGPGEHYLGSTEVSVPFGGDPDFSLSLIGVPEGHSALTLTASRLDLGVTSQFSRCVLIADAGQVAQADVGPGQTGPVLDAQGATVSVAPAAATLTSPGSAPARAGASGHDGGTLYVTRYEAAPDTSVFADATAPAPGGAAVRPEAVAARYWFLADRGLSLAGGADSTATATFDVCLDPAGVVVPVHWGEVVVVRRDEATGGAWVPHATTLAPHGEGPYLCASGLAALGEFGIGGAPSAFPVGAEDGPLSPERPLAFGLAAYPNPVRSAASVVVSVPAPQRVSAAVYDLLGRRVAVLHEGPLAVGTHVLEWKAGALPSGVYVVRAVGETAVQTQRVTVVR